MTRIISALLAISLMTLVFGVALAQTNAPNSTAKTNNKVTTTGFSYLVEPIPSWVVAAKGEVAVQLPHSSLHYEIIDEQARLDKSSASFYSHVVRVVDEDAGLGTAAQIEIAFDPSYQVLVFHKIGIWRGGHRIDKLDRKKIKLLQRETQLEYRIYDGQVTASIVLDDVRVGDRIDYSYSLSGSNPVFDGKFIYTAFATSERGPVALYQFRLLAPENRVINYRVGSDIKISTNVHSGIRETVFRRVSAPQFQYDADVPEATYLTDTIQFSEFGDWKAVAHWGEKLYESGDTPSVGVHKEADAIRATAKTPFERLGRALDFVQNDVRYFGIEIGPNTHHPSSPETVITQRFGDCKDKVSLLVALLKDLNIDAAPTLVSTHYGNQLDSVIPSPLAFNHVIARVQLDGKVYWLDGTRSHQTGSLDQRQSVGLGEGLVLLPNADNLTALLGTTSEERITVDETIHVNKFSEPPVLESHITYYGEFAEALRNVIATQPIDEIKNKLDSDYGRLYPQIHSDIPLRIEEVPNQNAVSVVQQFTLPKFWRFPDERILIGDIPFWNVIQALRIPNEPDRKKPFRIQYPGIYRHNVAMNFSEDVARTNVSDHFDEGDANFQYRVTYSVTPRNSEMHAELHLIKDRVEAVDWPEYTDKLTKMQPRLQGYIQLPAVTLSQADELKKDLNDLTESLQRGTIKYVTPIQLKARVRQLVLTTQLESGRLNPTLRAQALNTLGEQLDWIGDPEKASADFEEAIKLDPNNPDIIDGAAVNDFLRGQYSKAVELEDREHQLAPSHTFINRAFSNYFNHKYADAKQDLLETLKNRSETENIYPAIWLYLTARQLGEDGVKAVKPYMPTFSEPRWPYPILQLYIGTGDYEHALQAAKSDPKDPSKLCELYFYVGEKYLLDGDTRHAREYFKKSVDTGVVEFNEYSMSKRSIEALGEN